ncbi:MAG: hypothetical protein ACREJ0_00675 [Geminicoccaceae bacterium]
MFSASRNYLLGMLAEFRRANAAAQRYEDLRYRSASHGSIAQEDIPGRVFAEIYAVGETVESRRPAPGRSSPPEHQGGTAQALS